MSDEPKELAATKTWEHPCPECGTIMSGTGDVIWDADVDHWYVEFWCAKDQEVITIYTPECHAHVDRLLSGT